MCSGNSKGNGIAADWGGEQGSAWHACARTLMSWVCLLGLIGKSYGNCYWMPKMQLWKPGPNCENEMQLDCIAEWGRA